MVSICVRWLSFREVLAHDHYVEKNKKVKARRRLKEQDGAGAEGMTTQAKVEQRRRHKKFQLNEYQIPRLRGSLRQ